MDGTDFDPLNYVRLTELAEGIPWTYEALRIYANRGVLPIKRNGSSLYVRRDVAAEMLDDPNSHDNLRDLIDTALDNTPTHDMSDSDNLIDTSVSELADRLGVAESRVRSELNEWDGPHPVAGKVTLSPDDLSTLSNAVQRR
jgi:hypothetical protein